MLLLAFFKIRVKVGRTVTFAERSYCTFWVKEAYMLSHSFTGELDGFCEANPLPPSSPLGTLRIALFPDMGHAVGT